MHHNVKQTFQARGIVPSAATQWWLAPQQVEMSSDVHTSKMGKEMGCWMPGTAELSILWA